MFERFAGRMLVEKPNLGDRGCAHEAGALVELRAGLHAAAAGDATRDRVSFFLLDGIDTRSRAEIICAVHRYPRFDAFQVFKKHAAVDGQIAHDGKLAQRLNLDRLLKFIYQGRAGHAGAAIDQHGAGAADLFQAVGIVGDGSRGLAVARNRIGGNLHHGRNHVHSRLPGKRKLFPARLGLRIFLTLDLENNRPGQSGLIAVSRTRNKFKRRHDRIQQSDARKGPVYPIMLLDGGPHENEPITEKMIATFRYQRGDEFCCCAISLSVAHELSISGFAKIRNSGITSFL